MAERVSIVTVSAPKIGCEPCDSDDAFAVASTRDASRLRVTVADGATSSSFSGLWATMLTQGFVTEPFLDEAAMLARRSTDAERWDEAIRNMALPWHARRQAARGAHATFAGAELLEDPELIWRAIAIGDSCVIHIRSGLVLASFPCRDGAEFDNQPKLLATSATYGDPIVAGDISIVEGEARCGDVLVLATDAVAKFLLDRSRDAFTSLFASLVSDANAGSTADSIINRFREEGELANDDLTVVILVFA